MIAAVDDARSMVGSRAATLALFLVSLGAACERKPPEPRPLADAAQAAEADGVPFSASCQTWKSSDLKSLLGPDADASIGLRRLDAIWRALVKSHLDPTLACLDWPRVREQQLTRLGDSPRKAAVDKSFAKVFSQLAPEAPKIKKSGKGRPLKHRSRPASAAPIGQARLSAYNKAGQLLSKESSEGRVEGEESRSVKNSQAPEIPSGMELAWWTLGSWTMRAIKQIETARNRVGQRGEPGAEAAVIDLRETGGTSMRSVLRLLGQCTPKSRRVGELTDRKGVRALKVKRSEAQRLPSRLIVLTSERSSTHSQLFAYLALSECDARWWFESDAVNDEGTPVQARRPRWFESTHRLPGGGQLVVRGGRIELEAKRAGPVQSAELRSVAEMETRKLIAVLHEAEGVEGTNDASQL